VRMLRISDQEAIRNPVHYLYTVANNLVKEHAVLDRRWTASGDKNPNGTARKRRYCMMTMVAEKRNGSWLVVASQNDNADPWSPLDGEIPHLAMPIPGPDQERQ
jgi:hypothetical protein